MTTARLVTREGVEGYELTHGEEVTQVDSLVEFDVQALLRSRNEQVGIELLLKLMHLLQTSLQALSGAAHTYILPHDVTQLLVDRVNRTLTLDVEQTIELCIHLLLSLCKLRQIGRNLGPYSLVSQVVLDGVRQYEVTISQTLHQRRSTQTVSTMVGEVTLTDSKQARDSGLQLIVNPDTTHGIVDSRIDHHGLVVLHTIDLVGYIAREYVGNLLVHLEQVAIALHDHIDAQTVDRLREVEEHSQTGVVHTEALVAALLSGTRGHVTGNEVTECRIAALQIVVAILLGNLPTLLGTSLQSLGVLNLLGHPDTTIVTQ